nr:MAG TPA: hypothetical protein [Caudoviricetes sp.]
MQFYLNGAEATLTDFARDDLARAVVNSLFFMGASRGR